MRSAIPLTLPAITCLLLFCEASGSTRSEAGTTKAAAKGDDLIATINKFEAESFADESEARRIENEGIVPLWDALLAAPAAERLDLLASVPFDTLTLGKAGKQKHHDLGIITRKITSGGKTLTADELQSRIDIYKKAGYRLDHSDWHHSAYARNAEGQAVSEVSFTLQGTRNEGIDRLQFKGTLRIIWDESGDDLRPATISLLKATSAQRRGAPAFRNRAVLEGGDTDPNERDDMGAVSVYDLNGDQLPEIILGNANKILWNKGDFLFEPGPLIDSDGMFFDSVSGLVSDLNGDGVLDWIGDTEKGDLALWFGKAGGGFSKIPKRVELGDFKLRVPSFITAGDIDHDGDLDLYVGQWRSLYESMPETFWDANDGFGNTLLLNDGDGNFKDATIPSGLGTKRFRRAYSGSFLDLDGDSDLDLLVISDFHGVDVFINDGKGMFSEQTDDQIDNPYSFGMSHTVADYDGDGQSDFYVVGMGSTTARRLDLMNANPEDHAEHNRMRGVMGYGNRMYLAREGGRFKAPAYADQVSRTGWTWGTASADFDNDGDQDIYAANGHISGKSSRDYCTNFWCRDIYLLQGYERPAISNYLQTLPQMEKQSWDGYQVNPLLLNQSGEGFEDFGFLLDVGFDFDCRRVIATDLDLDGRNDLIVGRIEGTSGFFHDGRTKVEPPALLLMKNTLPEAANRAWIGVTLGTAPGISPQGAKVILNTSDGTRESVVLSGDSFMCQHPAQKHFGLGAGTIVKSIEVIWPGGRSTQLSEPSTGRYHPLMPPEE